MNRTDMNKLARKMIAQIAEEHELNSCEIGLPGCMLTFGVAPAHKHKRIHYRTTEELADFNEWVAACQACHDKIEINRKLTEDIFKVLRPLN